MPILRDLIIISYPCGVSKNLKLSIFSKMMFIHNTNLEFSKCQNNEFI